MCIAILKPKGIKIFESVLKTCYENNDDGAGFMFAENKELKIFKGFFSFESFLEAYLPHQTKECVLHFRIKTHGAINTEMCHPVEITNNVAFVHNGVIYKMPYDKDKSDSYLFSELMLKQLVEKYGKQILFDPQMKALLEDYIGGSKLIFMDYKGRTIIYNQRLGEENTGIWFSNGSWKTTWNTYVPKATQPEKKKKKYNSEAKDQTKKSSVIFLPGVEKTQPEEEATPTVDTKVAWPNIPKQPTAEKTLLQFNTKKAEYEYRTQGKILTIGTRVRLREPWKNWKAGDEAIVDSFGAGMSIFISGLYPMEGQEEQIPILLVDVIEDTDTKGDDDNALCGV